MISAFGTSTLLHTTDAKMASLNYFVLDGLLSLDNTLAHLMRAIISLLISQDTKLPMFTQT